MKILSGILLGVINVINIIVISSIEKNNKKETFQTGGSIEPKMTNIDDNVKTKYLDLVDKLGDPSRVEINNNNDFMSATWMVNLNNFKNKDYGKFNGLDVVKVYGEPVKKYHPHPAIVFVEVGKYMDVPEHLYGPLSYASETINIQKLFIPKSEQDKYFSTGIKSKTVSLVTGSCASITISAITVKFVEDMIKKYKLCDNTSLEYNKLFRSEYDKRIHTYLCDGGIKPSIDWFDHTLFDEPEKYNIGKEKCKLEIKTYKEPECKKLP